MTRTTSLFLVLSCAAFVAVISNCGSSSPTGAGNAGSTGSAGANGSAGSTVPTGNGTGGDTGNGTAGAIGTAGNPGGGAGRNGGGGGAGGVVCRATGTCAAAGDTCETTCQGRTHSSCACIDAGNGRLEWGCVQVACTNNNDGGAGGTTGGGGNGGGGRGGFAGRGGNQDGGFGDSGITIVDGGVVLPACPANTVSGTTTCNAQSMPACATTCTNMMQQSCFCARGRYTCTRAHACQ